MSILDRFRKIKEVQIVNENKDYDYWDIKSLGNIIVPEKLNDTNAFMLANTVSEIFFPIDFYADRISKLRFYIAKNTGTEAKNTELTRFVTEINPLFSFSDLVYQYVFSYFADGNALNYLSLPSLYSGSALSVNNITRWDVLNPDITVIDEHNRVNTLELTSKTDAIKKATYCENSKETELDKQRLFIHNSNIIRKSGSYILSRSPLFQANKSIDVLMAVYSARYNVYANNGAAGYLAKKQTVNSQNAEFEAAISDISQREKILNDINSRNGLTGKRNLWGISGVPIEFVKTIATISELLPMEETLENSIKIASIFQIPPELVPRKDQSTFSNQIEAERSVWENGLLSMASTVEQNLTKLFGLDKIKYQIKVDYSSVSALRKGEKEREENIMNKLRNLDLMKKLNPGLDINEEIQKLYDQYGE